MTQCILWLLGSNHAVAAGKCAHMLCLQATLKPARTWVEACLRVEVCSRPEEEQFKAGNSGKQELEQVRHTCWQLKATQGLLATPSKEVSSCVERGAQLEVVCGPAAARLLPER